MAPIPQHQFKQVGGHPVLDFINTMQDWTVPELQDYLGGFADAVRFGKAARLLTPSDVLCLRHRKSHTEVTRLRQLRALLRRIFQTQLRLAGEKRSSATDLKKLGADLAEAARATQLTVANRSSSSRPVLRREITVEKAGPAVLRLRIVEAAVALLASNAVSRVNTCPACGWFFLDVSKNRSRRWCSMDTCGSVAKARRYYRRLKERAAA